MTSQWRPLSHKEAASLMSGTSGLANLNYLKCECDILLKKVLSVRAALREGHFALATSKLEDLQAALAKHSFCDIPQAMSPLPTKT